MTDTFLHRPESIRLGWNIGGCLALHERETGQRCTAHKVWGWKAVPFQPSEPQVREEPLPDNWMVQENDTIFLRPVPIPERAETTTSVCFGTSMYWDDIVVGKTIIQILGWCRPDHKQAPLSTYAAYLYQGRRTASVLLYNYIIQEGDRIDIHRCDRNPWYG